MRSIIKKVQTIVTSGQVVGIFLAFALMVGLSSWYMSNIYRNHIENAGGKDVITTQADYYQELRRIRLVMGILGMVFASVLSAILLKIVSSRAKSEERMRIMFDSMPLGANIHYKSGFVDCNENVVKLFGLSSKQEYFDKFEQLSPEYQPDGRLSNEKRKEYTKKAFSEGFCRFEWMHQNLDGDPIPCEVTLVRVKYGNELALAVYILDLRQLKSTIEQVSESEQSISILSNILNGLDAMIYVTVPETGEILFVNNNMREHFNLKDDGIGQLCYKVFQIGMDEKCSFCPCRQLDKDPNSVVVWEEHNDLTKHIYRNTDRYIEWQNGKLAHIQHSVDITELIAAKEKAEQSSRFKSQFLSRMSHEVRTPMNAILGITEIQLQDETLPHDMQEIFGKIYNSGYLLLGIINDILDLSKIEAGRLELLPVNYDVPSLINDTVYLNIMRFDSKPFAFELEVDENIPLTLFGDELRIKQILNNLLSNAFKYTNEGKVSLSIHVDNTQRNEKGKITLVFSVSDTGQGMSREQIEKLFDEYTRFNPEANRTVEGAGLGMNITRHLINLMNGTISIESEPGKGSTFTVRLSQGIVDAGVLGKSMVENLKQFRRGRVSQMKKAPQILREFMPYGKVLIVDDVETNLYVAKGLMIPYGLSIETAGSGFDAIKKIKEGMVFDIIFMDHFMPRMDGVETTKNIRGLGYKNTIVALTANAIAGQAEMFMANGFNGFISKPIDIRQLNVLLNKFVRDKYPPEVIEAAQQQALKNNMVKKTQPPSDPELAAIFARDAEKSIARLDAIYVNAFRRTEDIRQYVIDVHAMKSALANIGETGLSAKAFKLEQAGKAEDKAVMMSETPVFLEELRKVIEKNKRKANANDTTVTEDSPEALAFLKEKLPLIRKACEEYDEVAAATALSELKQISWSNSVEEMLDAISEHLLHSDFEEAAALAKDWLQR
ncbi:MAG: response regulator [Treponema sp.]|jgi:signal transduction histidine kinase/CheY-like chemotaxis protein/HPt (histidine-containing phosphotransfer) domain-containing protein|nr:response regulator [Treponema sp.]